MSPALQMQCCAPIAASKSIGKRFPKQRERDPLLKSHEE
jgi:hypothetical protein